MHNTEKIIDKIKYLFNIPILLFSSMGFIYLMIIASHNRLFADDYCYLLHLRLHGLFNSIIESYLYLNGRWLSHVINYLLYSIDEFFIYTAPLLFFILAFAIGFVLYPLFGASQQRLFSIISISVFLTLLVILISPEFFLTSIWTLHVAILVGGLTCTLVACGLFIRLMIQKIPANGLWKFLLFLFALFSTSFHEAIGLLAFYIYFLLLLLEIKIRKSKQLPLAIYLLFGAIIGIVSVLFTSSNINRAEILRASPEPSKIFANIGLLIIKYLFFLAGEYLSDWRGLLIPLLAFLTGLIISKSGNLFQKFTLNSSLRKFSLFIYPLPFSFSIMVIFPFVFVSGYFPLRTFFVIGFILTVGNFVLGLWIGQFERFKPISLRTSYGLWLFLFLVISISSTIRLNNYLDQIIKYANEFDNRETLIQNAIKDNHKYIKVPKYNYLLDVEWASDVDSKEIDCNLPNSDTYPIILLLSENPPNCCFSRYYGIPILLEGKYR